MKTLLQKTLMVMLAAFLSLSFASCSDDEDDDDNNGAMTGWVEIEGKKYNFKFFRVNKQPAGYLSIEGYSTKNYKEAGSTGTYNWVELRVKFNQDGTLDPEGMKDSSGDNPQFDFHIVLNEDNSSDTSSKISYDNLYNTGDRIDGKLSGKKITIDGVDVKLNHNSNYGQTLDDKRSVWADFHFEGVPQNW